MEKGSPTLDTRTGVRGHPAPRPRGWTCFLHCRGSREAFTSRGCAPSAAGRFCDAAEDLGRRVCASCGQPSDARLSATARSGALPKRPAPNRTTIRSQRAHRRPLQHASSSFPDIMHQHPPHRHPRAAAAPPPGPSTRPRPLTSSPNSMSDSEGGDGPCCWICLGTDGPLARPCACPRAVHARCLARWRLQQAGRPEEAACRFCGRDYAFDWRDQLRGPLGLEPAAPVMAVSVSGAVHKIRVRPGPEGKAAFRQQVRAPVACARLRASQSRLRRRAAVGAPRPGGGVRGGRAAADVARRPNLAHATLTRRAAGLRHATPPTRCSNHPHRRAPPTAQPRTRSNPPTPPNAGPCAPTCVTALGPQVRQLLGYDSSVEFDVLFECKVPCSGARARRRPRACELARAVRRAL